MKVSSTCFTGVCKNKKVMTKKTCVEKDLKSEWVAKANAGLLLMEISIITITPMTGFGKTILNGRFCISIQNTQDTILYCCKICTRSRVVLAVYIQRWLLVGLAGS